LHDGGPNPLPDDVTVDPPRSLLVGGLNVNSPGMEPATIARFGLAGVTFQVIVDAIPESAPPPGGEQEQGPAQGQQEGQPESQTLVAWAPNQGDPACWDPVFALTHAYAWVVGECVGVEWWQPSPQEFCNQMAVSQPTPSLTPGESPHGWGGECIANPVTPHMHGCPLESDTPCPS